MGDDTKSLLGSSLSAGLQSGTSGAAAMAMQVTSPIHFTTIFFLLAGG